MRVTAAPIPQKPEASQPPPTPRAPSIAESRSGAAAHDDDAIPDHALEFNADATDVSKVFVEQPPSPEFKAATGTFKALMLKAEEAARQEHLAQADAPAEAPLDPVRSQVDIEIDPDVLAAMAQMSSDRLEKLELPAASETRPVGAAPGTHSPTATAPTTSSMQPPVMQSPAERAAGTPPVMRLAERAKARAEAARPLSLETTEAIRAALAPRRPRIADSEADGETSKSFGTIWATGSAVLLVLLLVQVVHHYRSDLAATETFNGPLTSLYAAMGMPLVPRWNLTAYEVRQLGASTAADAPGQITVRASVKNGAHQSQPLPLLRVTLQDRFGNRIAARDVPPQSYLPRAIPRSSRLSAGQRIDAEMAFVDPGSNAVGFEIDACLPAPGGGVSCANDFAR